ncbi:MAG: DNA methylase [Lachnospiraceae bacterium]|nr:DNA methylase [Lachnospiraceae bacterium]
MADRPNHQFHKCEAIPLPGQSAMGVPSDQSVKTRLPGKTAQKNFSVRRDSRTYIAIDLKSFYASIECAARDLDPMRTNLVVADNSRTEKTICLAVSPSLKSYGIGGRARLFEVIEKVKGINAARLAAAPGHVFKGKSADNEALKADPSLELDYVVAPPRMALYMQCSTDIYEIYLRYIAPEDIHVYSIDEVFMDVTDYLETYKKTPHELTMMLIREVLKVTGITATAGIGSNLYLAKVAMDIVAKHMEPDEDGVRIAELNERTYREKLWHHRPLTDFWRIGPGYKRKLEKVGLMTMGDVARCSLGGPRDFYNEDLLYKLFGVNAELLIDHAWGWEPCRMSDIKAYRPDSSSVGSGQVLTEPYPFDKARLVVREMTELLSLDLTAKHLVTDQVVLTVSYDIENLTDPERRKRYKGPIVTDYYGRQAPKHAHGTEKTERPTASTRLIADAMMRLFDRVVNPDLLVRRLSVCALHVMDEAEVEAAAPTCHQMSLFDYDEKKTQAEAAALERLEKEKRLQQAAVELKKRFGKNAVLKGMNLEEGATTIMRNNQIGGHKA